MKTFVFRVSSWKNISFNYTEEFTLDDLGHDEETWSELSENEQDAELEEHCQQLLFEYVEFSYSEVET